MFRDRALKELPQVERDVQEAEEHLEHLEALQAEGRLSGHHEQRLLRTLRQTYEMQLLHLKTLKSEAEGGF
jgi:hypothetical protein